MSFSAKIIADSISPQDIRLTTFELRYPRFIHSELMTHRKFTRNASSSRAIPVEKMIRDIMDDTAMPIHWGANQKGMQANMELSPTDRSKAMSCWRTARNRAIDQAEKLIKLGVHKQIVNRLLEPFAHITVLVTATDYNNWFALRDHEAAMPEIQYLARMMKLARDISDPKLLRPGEWHLPYVRKDAAAADYDNYLGDNPSSGAAMNLFLCKLSVARCARVSYLTHDGEEPSIEADLKLYDRLVGSTPLHASPCEHQATPDRNVGNEVDGDRWHRPKLHGNFRGWVQFRKTLADEYVPG